MVASFKLVVLFFICVSSLEHKVFRRRHGPPPPKTPKRTTSVYPIWDNITQRVDHFNPKDSRTWIMRYIRSNEFFKKSGPIFIYIGGEWTINPEVVMAGEMLYDMAKEHQGYMFYTEHRYYGQSYPLKPLSMANLRYLTVDQALADLVYFIEYIKRTIEGLENSKVVVVGCSYSANMAIWLRSKYPHVVDAAYASSGPVRAVAEFDEYYEVVENNLAMESEDCLEIIREGTAELVSKLDTIGGIEEMSERLSTCSQIKNEEPYRTHFFDAVITAHFGGNFSLMCATLLEYEGTPLDKIIAYVNLQYEGYCIGSYDDHITDYRKEDETERTWMYQVCTQFGFFMTTNSENQPFVYTTSIDSYTQGCTDIFGEKFRRVMVENGIKRTNLFYGSANPQVTKLVAVYGTLDPWHTLGILEDLNPLAPAIVINGSDHCTDNLSISYEDSDELKAAKIRIKELIAEWISD